MFIFAYIIPLFIMVYCNTKIYLEVNRTCMNNSFHIYVRYTIYQDENHYGKMTQVQRIKYKIKKNVWQKQFFLLLVSNLLL